MYTTPQADLPRFIMPPTTQQAYDIALAAQDAVANISTNVSTYRINTSGPDFYIDDSNVADIIELDIPAIGAGCNVIIDKLSKSKIIVVKDILGGASSNTIAIEAGSGVTAYPTISPLYRITNDFGSVTLFFNANNNTLTVI